MNRKQINRRIDALELAQSTSAETCDPVLIRCIVSACLQANSCAGESPEAVLALAECIEAGQFDALPPEAAAAASSQPEEASAIARRIAYYLSTV